MNEVCLVGNPNCGKTTLFNMLTGTYQKVGNWAGVTVEKKQGKLKSDKSKIITDLPGLYSLKPTSPDERVVIEFLKTFHGLIVNVIDATNLERSLYLTMSLIKLNLPVVVAINKIDSLKKEKIKLNLENIKQFLGVPVIEISARKNIGIEELINYIKEKNIINKNNLINISENNFYNLIEKNINNFISEINLNNKNITKKIDKILTHNFFGIIIFLIIIYFIYYCSLKLGGVLSEKIITLLNNFCIWLTNGLGNIGLTAPSIDLLVNGVIKGIGTVLSFLPHLLILFTFTTFLEECGYNARVSYIFDNLFSKLNLSGKSVIPFILSCGCTVSGIEASKTIENTLERERTILLCTFLPCGAKMAVFGWFSTVFFGGSPLVALSLYALSFAVVILLALFFKEKDSKDKGFFILELPSYSMPTVKDILAVLYNKTKEFLVKNGTVIFALSIILWLLKNFGIHGYAFNCPEKSFLYAIGNGLKYIFYPLGFSNWQATVSVLTGIFAKEAVVESLQILSTAPNTLFANGYSVYAFMAFTLLSPPCVASLSIAKRELGSGKKLIKMICVELLMAYGVAVTINFIGIILSLSIGLILSVLIGIILLIGLSLALKRIIKVKYCVNCANCKKVNCGKKNHVRLYARSRL